MREGTCIHFTGMANEKCEKGINYSEHVGHDGPGWAGEMPCIAESKFRDRIRAKRQDMKIKPCALYTEPTKEQLKAWREEIDSSFSNMMVARSVIVKSGQAKGHVLCPVCSGKLHFTVSPTNGHIWANCETEKCLSWVE